MVVRLFNIWEWNGALLGLQVGAIRLDSPGVDGEIELCGQSLFVKNHPADAEINSEFTIQSTSSYITGVKMIGLPKMHLQSKY